MVQGKSTNSLMKHMRNKHGISISGSKQKKDLLNIGYYHGYKGYRFIKNTSNFIEYEDFNQVMAVYQFDMKLKSIFYPHIMFIETAIKNRTLDTILKNRPADFESVYSDILIDYKDTAIDKSTNSGKKTFKNRLQKRLKLREDVYSAISFHLNKKQFIEHYFYHDKVLPLWAIFPILTLGTFSDFINSMDKDCRLQVANDLNLKLSNLDSSRVLEQYIHILNPLRNSVAHNSIIFDCRFRNSKPAKNAVDYLSQETGVTNITFETIVDYFILITYTLQKLNTIKTDLKRLIKEFVDAKEQLRSSIPNNVYNKIIGTEAMNKLENLSKYI